MGIIQAATSATQEVSKVIKMSPSAAQLGIKGGVTPAAAWRKIVDENYCVIYPKVVNDFRHMKDDFVKDKLQCALSMIKIPSISQIMGSFANKIGWSLALTDMVLGRIKNPLSMISVPFDMAENMANAAVGSAMSAVNSMSNMAGNMMNSVGNMANMLSNPAGGIMGQAAGITGMVGGMVSSFGGAALGQGLSNAAGAMQVGANLTLGNLVGAGVSVANSAINSVMGSVSSMIGNAMNSAGVGSLNAIANMNVGLGMLSSGVSGQATDMAKMVSSVSNNIGQAVSSSLNKALSSSGFSGVGSITGGMLSVTNAAKNIFDGDPASFAANIASSATPDKLVSFVDGIESMALLSTSSMLTSVGDTNKTGEEVQSSLNVGAQVIAGGLLSIMSKNKDPQVIAPVIERISKSPMSDKIFGLMGQAIGLDMAKAQTDTKLNLDENRINKVQELLSIIGEQTAPDAVEQIKKAGNPPLLNGMLKGMATPVNMDLIRLNKPSTTSSLEPPTTPPERSPQDVIKQIYQEATKEGTKPESLIGHSELDEQQLSQLYMPDTSTEVDLMSQFNPNNALDSVDVYGKMISELGKIFGETSPTTPTEPVAAEAKIAQADMVAEMQQQVLENIFGEPNSKVPRPNPKASSQTRHGYSHLQEEPKLKWIIPQSVSNLSTADVVVNVFDSAGFKILEDECYVDASKNVVITFTEPVSGKAVICSILDNPPDGGNKTPMDKAQVALENSIDKLKKKAESQQTDSEAAVDKNKTDSSDPLTKETQDSAKTSDIVKNPPSSTSSQGGGGSNSADVLTSEGYTSDSGAGDSTSSTSTSTTGSTNTTGDTPSSTTSSTSSSTSSTTSKTGGGPEKGNDAGFGYADATTKTDLVNTFTNRP